MSINLLLAGALLVLCLVNFTRVADSAGETVYVTMVDFLPEKPLPERETRSLLEELQEQGIKVGRVYRGLSRVGATMSIDDLALGIQSLVSQQQAAFTQEQMEKVSQKIKHIEQQRSELVACQSQIGELEMSSRTLLLCSLQLLDQEQRERLTRELLPNGDEK